VIKNKKIKSTNTITKGFTVDQLFSEVARVSKKAKKGDKASKKLIDSAYEIWSKSGKYAY
jgi:hypothetical protein